ncbi:hypothetical protein OEA66_10235 [Chryseobacterium sp. KC 927]|uniref:Cell wall anchor protein n=1 Tax=Chryseobacterium luquanense TaxID=2983766 RepID=A0ABT3Y3K1_9FLAO|nr:hypothetical protein [Chryseobacterium luquanense]
MSILCGLNASAQSSWSLTGNSGTNPQNNFIGTTDANNLVFKTNNVIRFQVTGNGSNVFYGADVMGRFANYIDDISIDGFRVLDEMNGYNYMRVDGKNKIVYLQEKLGKVVIGSSTLADCSDCNEYKLFVNEGIRTEKVKVDIAANNGWADYVFAKDYKLMPLKELDQFINKNGHLPEVPTTEEAIKNGIELKEMNILLLKKIEELTLYTIEQQKRIEALENKSK